MWISWFLGPRVIRPRCTFKARPTEARLQLRTHREDAAIHSSAAAVSVEPGPARAHGASRVQPASSRPWRLWVLAASAPPPEAYTCGSRPPEPHALPCEAGAQHQRTEEPDSGSKKLGGAPWPGRRRQQKASGEALGPWRGPGGAVALVQAVPPGVETPRALFQTFSRVLPQKEAAVVCPAEGPRSSPADCEERVAEPCTEPGRLPSLPDDEVFLDEAPLGRLSLPPEACTPQAAQARVRASDPNSGTGLDRATAPPRCPLHECPGTAGAEDCWQGVNGSTGVARPTSCSLPRTANGDIPATDSTVLLTPATPSAAESDPLKPPPSNALGPSGSAAADPPHHPSLAWGTGQLGSRPIWPSQRLEELVQELAKLDPSLSDTLASDPSPEPPLGLLDGLIPLTEAHAAVRPGEEAAGTSEPRSYPFSFTQLLPASQEKTRPENATLQPVPSQPCVQELPAPNVSIQAKKVELAGLLQNMLQNLHSKQEQLQGGAEAWSRRRAALEAAVRQSCAPRELERFSRFMADLERVLGLLLLLGSRLARVHRALARLGPDGDPEERASLLQRLGLLQRQQEDAQELKEHVSRRERALREVLAQALPEEEVRAYCTLLADKAAVLAQQRNLDEQVRFLQDQLDTIRSDLSHRPLSPRPSWLPKTCLDKQPFPSPPI
ncbi:protein Shroom1 [Fukomys damarensis]|uniref:protein Shroom1 n=1 Tax=Fukomys damarensis TaxID=885580 RepID=UPI00053F8DFD|nr:protein Shroom1 [Fukomys damarensis]